MTTDAVATPSTSPVPGNVASPPQDSVGAQVLEAAAAQSAAKPTPNGKVYADWDELIAKSIRSTDYKVHLRQPDGTDAERWIKLEALSGPDYDAMVEKHPPTQKQREQGDIYNKDTFMPALIAACAVKPKLTVEQLKELRESKAWSAGEFGGIFLACQRINNTTPDVSFIVTG